MIGETCVAAIGVVRFSVRGFGCALFYCKGKAKMEEKKLTGYPSIDKPWLKGVSYTKRHPIIPNTSIYAILKLISLCKMKNIAVDCNNITVTYKELFADTDTVARALNSLNVKHGDIISICMPNCYQAVITFLALNKIGAVATFLNPGMSTNEIKEYLMKYSSPVFFGYDKIASDNQKLISDTKLKYIVNLDHSKVSNRRFDGLYHDNTKTNIIDFHCLGSIASQKKKYAKRVHAGKNDALILYTSGSTGQPKSVVLTNKNVISALMYANNTSKWDKLGISRILVCVPFAYPYGFVTSLLSALFSGSVAILAPDIGNDTVAAYYAKKPEMVFGSPALLNLTTKNIQPDRDLSSVKSFVSGGDFLTDSHRDRGIVFFHEHNANVEIGNGFGNAETVSIATTPVGVKYKPGTVGKVLVGTNAVVIDPDTLEEKHYGEEGLLCIAGKHVFKEYYNEPQLTKDAKISFRRKEYFKTGTIGYLDKDGYFTIVSRSSRFYICSSLNKIYLDHVQSVISHFKGVKDCAAVSVADDDQLYVNYVFIVLDEKANVGKNIEETILSMCMNPVTLANGKTDQLKDFEIPKKVLVINELPRREGTEKIDYRALEKQAEEMSKA